MIETPQVDQYVLISVYVSFNQTTVDEIGQNTTLDRIKTFELLIIIILGSQLGPSNHDLKGINICGDILYGTIAK